MIVLDTNVVSELMRPFAAPQVRRWVDGHASTDLWISSMTVAELLAGVAVLPEGRRKQALGRRVGELVTDVFGGRIVPFGEGAAIEYARIVAARRRVGRPMSTADAVIAASCLSAAAEGLATRNVDDFAGIGLPLFDPWASSPDD